MKTKIFIVSFIFITCLFLMHSALAESYTLTIKGEPRTPDNKIDLMYDAGIADDTGTLQSDKVINNDEGYFEVRNVVLDPNSRFGHVSVFAAGTCFQYTYNIFRKNGQFEVSDAYDPAAKVLIATKNTNIDLGVLKEDKSNYVKVDSSEGVKFLAEDTSGNWVAERGGFSGDTGSFNSFKSNTPYNITLENKDGKKWTKTITTGGYCEGTRIIKRGNYLSADNFPNNSFPSIGFWQSIGLFFRGLFS